MGFDAASKAPPIGTTVDKQLRDPPPLPRSRGSTPSRAERCDSDPTLPRGPERFFYDTARYTGCARYGGPSVVDKCAESPKAGAQVWTDALRGSSCRGSSLTRGNCASS